MNIRVKYSLLICLIIGLVIAGYLINRSKDDSPDAGQQPGELSEAQRVDFERRLNQAQADINTPPPGSDIVDFYEDKGEALTNLGRLDEALNTYKEALVLDPNRSGLYITMHELQIKMNDLNAASESMRKYVELNSDSYLRWEKYIAYERNTLKSSADRIYALYSEALIKTKENENMLVSYARYLEEQGNLQSAKDNWVKAKANDPAGGAASYDAEINRLDVLIKAKAG